MGYNNPAFVDDDNKTSNSRSPIRLDEKRTTAPPTTKTTTESSTNDVIHDTTVNNTQQKLKRKKHIHTDILAWCGKQYTSTLSRVDQIIYLPVSEYYLKSTEFSE